MVLVRTADALSYFEHLLHFCEEDLRVAQENKKDLEAEYMKTFWYNWFKTPFEKSSTYKSLRNRCLIFEIDASIKQLKFVKSCINACNYHLTMNYSMFEWDPEMADIYKFYDWMSEQ